MEGQISNLNEIELNLSVLSDGEDLGVFTGKKAIN